MNATKPSTAAPESQSRCSDETAASGAALRQARESRLFQGREIIAPAAFLLQAELTQIAPGIDAGVVEIVELDADSVIADRLDLENADLGAAMDELFLARPVPLHFGGRALDAEILGREAKPRAVIEGDLEHLFRPPQADLGRPAFRGRIHDVGGAFNLAFSPSSSGRASSTSMIGMPSRMG